jgi:hypothetical protein
MNFHLAGSVRLVNADELNYRPIVHIALVITANGAIPRRMGSSAAAMPPRMWT